MGVSIFFAIAFILLILIGVIRQILRKNNLKFELKKYDSQKLLLTDNSEDTSHLNLDEFEIIRVGATELIDSNSFCRQLMKNQGVQRLPRIFWLNEDGQIENQRVS